MPPCSKEVVASFFFKFTSIFKLLFLFSYFFSVFVAKLFTFLCRSDEDEYEYDDETSCEDEEEEVDTVVEEEDEEVVVEGYRGSNYGKDMETEHLVANIIGGGEELAFLSRDQHYHQQNDDQSSLGDHHHLRRRRRHQTHHQHAHHNISNESIFEDPVESFDTQETSTTAASYTTPESNIHSPDSEFKGNNTEITVEEEEEEEEEEDSDQRQDYDSDINSSEMVVNEDVPQSPVITTINLNKHWILPSDNEDHHGQKCEEKIHEQVKLVVEEERSEFAKDENYLSCASYELERRKFSVLGKDRSNEEEEDADEVYGDTYTIGSTSKSSSEWRSSINCRDSTTTEDPFSSSSRRSCPKWESYTVYQKYDEEMMFLDRISAQKLHETESLKSFQVEPRSISQRIIHKFATKNKRSTEYQNPYYELEAAYVAQICLAWEALNWNYKNFQRKRALIKGSDLGCPAKIAQQFQQFQVLLQRYIENEPYEYGRRPEIYARMRGVTPKLLQVPEYHDYEDAEKEGVLSSRISSASFLAILEESIRTFMNFLKGDKETHCRTLAAWLSKRRNRKGCGSVDPALLHMMKKTNKKKKLKLKDLQRAGKCFRKKKLRIEEEMEVLMGLIDLKVVSRVLRMDEMTRQQLKWCEEKMAKVRLSQGQLHRDSSPLFYPPAH